MILIISFRFLKHFTDCKNFEVIKMKQKTRILSFHNFPFWAEATYLGPLHPSTYFIVDDVFKECSNSHFQSFFWHPASQTHTLDHRWIFKIDQLRPSSLQEPYQHLGSIFDPFWIFKSHNFHQQIFRNPRRHLELQRRSMFDFQKINGELFNYIKSKRLF